jgi:hypothetical protein
VSAPRARRALLAASLLVAPHAHAETWDPAEVAEAEKLRVEEAARAAEYRERVAHGDVRAAAAPMPRDAPQTPRESAAEPLRDAADIVELIERLLGRIPADEAAPPPEPTREQLRSRERERHRDGADAWWEEEERRLQDAQ